MLAGWPSRARISGSRNRRAQMRDETGLPGRPSTRDCPRRPNISGLPGRMAIFQKASVMPRVLQDRADEIVIADRGAAAGDDDVGALCSREVGIEVCARVAGDAELLRRCTGGFRQGGDSQVVGCRDLAGTERGSPAARVRRRSKGWQPWDGGGPRPAHAPCWQPARFRAGPAAARRRAACRPRGSRSPWCGCGPSRLCLRAR